MYYKKHRHLVSQEQYNILAGSEWPSYQDFLQYKESDKQFIRSEMEEMLGNEITNLYAEYRRQRIRYFKELIFYGKMYHVWRAFVPAVLGTFLFFYLGGSIGKFLLIGAGCYVINFIYGNTIHRWLTHKQFTPKTWARYFLLFLVTLAGFGHVLLWTGVHLIHHKTSDGDDDPHPVRNGFWNTMLVATNLPKSMHNDPVFRRKLDPDIIFVAKHYWALHIASLLLLAIIDIDLFLLSFLFIKSGAAIINGCINYFGHTSSRNPNPTNVSILGGMFINGENWHKNHHDNPGRFNQADPGKIDLGYHLMKVFAKNGR